MQSVVFCFLLSSVQIVPLIQTLVNERGGSIPLLRPQVEFPPFPSRSRREADDLDVNGLEGSLLGNGAESNSGVKKVRVPRQIPGFEPPPGCSRAIDSDLV